MQNSNTGSWQPSPSAHAGPSRATTSNTLVPDHSSNRNINPTQYGPHHSTAPTVNSGTHPNNPNVTNSTPRPPLDKTWIPDWVPPSAYAPEHPPWFMGLSNDLNQQGFSHSLQKLGKHVHLMLFNTERDVFRVRRLPRLSWVVEPPSTVRDPRYEYTISMEIYQNGKELFQLCSVSDRQLAIGLEEWGYRGFCRAVPWPGYGKKESVSKQAFGKGRKNGSAFGTSFYAPTVQQTRAPAPAQSSTFSQSPAPWSIINPSTWGTQATLVAEPEQIELSRMPARAPTLPAPPPAMQGSGKAPAAPIYSLPSIIDPRQLAEGWTIMFLYEPIRDGPPIPFRDVMMRLGWQQADAPGDIYYCHFSGAFFKGPKDDVVQICVIPGGIDLRIPGSNRATGPWMKNR